jgi:hypothetical protein
MKRILSVLAFIIFTTAVLSPAEVTVSPGGSKPAFFWKTTRHTIDSPGFRLKVRNYLDADGSDNDNEPISSQRDEEKSDSSVNSSSSNSSGYDAATAGAWVLLALLFSDPATSLVTVSTILFITALATPPVLAVAIFHLSEYLKTGFEEQKEYATGSWAAFGTCFAIAVIPWIIVNIKFHDGTPMIPAFTMTYYALTFLTGAIAASAMLNLQYNYSNTPLYFETAATATGWGLTALFTILATTLFILTGRVKLYSSNKHKITIEPDMMGLRIRF